MNDRVCWLETVPEDRAEGELARIYQSLRRPDGSVHNLYKAFSPFPAPTLSADRLYRDVMHTPQAPLPLWLAELISVQVAHHAGCDYALAHHGANFVHLYRDAGHEDADAVMAAVKASDWSAPVLDDRLRAICRFVEKLSSRPDAMAESDIAALRDCGFDDGEISQTVQVVACFAYWVRVINALGISLGNESVGKY